MAQDCVFCRIARGELPADLVAESERWLAFRDLSPRAPVHVLIIPREHFESLRELEEAHRDLAGELLLAAQAVADQEGVGEGYRLVANTGPEAGQTVFHLHLHVIGGRTMRWPPG
jgi:histidine triad (HIT) family protein